jgi:hypothetical protein
MVLNETFIISLLTVDYLENTPYNPKSQQLNKGKAMSETISLTVPVKYRALKRAAEMLEALAGDCYDEVINPEDDFDTSTSHTITTENSKGLVEEILTEPQLSGRVDIPIQPQKVGILNEDGSIDDHPDFNEAIENSEIPDLDTYGIPWDDRIHSGIKAKTKGGMWKKKRGINELTINEVEAELKQLMSVGKEFATPSETIPKMDALATESVEDVAIARENLGSVTTAQEAFQKVGSVGVSVETANESFKEAATKYNNDTVMTLPGLLSAATSAGKSPDDMQKAADQVGIASIGLLAARPDLIPKVVQVLGL